MEHSGRSADRPGGWNGHVWGAVVLDRRQSRLVNWRKAARRMERSSWAQQGIDLERPSVARVYDYFLGGAHNFAVDRQLADAIAGITPASATPCGPTGRSCAGPCASWSTPASPSSWTSGPASRPSATCTTSPAGPTPSARVVYVDIDPIAVSHSRVILAGDPRTAVIQADARDTERILERPGDHPGARPRPAGRGAADRRAGLRPGRARPGRHRGPAARRDQPGQLPRPGQRDPREPADRGGRGAEVAWAAPGPRSTCVPAASCSPSSPG